MKGKGKDSERESNQERRGPLAQDRGGETNTFENESGRIGHESAEAAGKGEGDFDRVFKNGDDERGIRRGGSAKRGRTRKGEGERSFRQAAGEPSEFSANPHAVKMAAALGMSNQGGRPGRGSVSPKSPIPLSFLASKIIGRPD